MTSLALDEIDRVLEATLMLRASEVALLHDVLETSVIRRQDKGSRVDAFCFGVIESLADRLVDRFEPLFLLTYIYAVVDHGPGEKARKALAELLSLRTRPELGQYIAGGRQQVQAILRGDRPKAGLVAGLLLEELERTAPDP